MDIKEMKKWVKEVGPILDDRTKAIEREYGIEAACNYKIGVLETLELLKGHVKETKGIEVELTCHRMWYECDNLKSEPAPERYQGRFDDPEEAIRFMAEMCAKSDQWECYVYGVEIIEEVQE